MDAKEVFEAGKNRGYNIASWNDIPDIGWKIPRHLDWVGYKVVDAENRKEVFEMLCNEAESNNREYSPFEFTAKELNELDNDETIEFDPWEEYENGITEGIREYIAKAEKNGVFDIEEEEGEV